MLIRETLEKIELFKNEYCINKIFLFVTATNIETQALINVLEPVSGRKEIDKLSIRKNTYLIGKIGLYNVVHVQCGDAGAIGRDASITTVIEAINDWKPCGIIMVGIAFGKDRKKQKIGDVLISKSVINYESARVSKDTTQYRSKNVESGQILFNRFYNIRNWCYELTNTKAQIIYGPMLSGEKLIDNEERKQILFAQFPNAIGGEMEGFGVYTAAATQEINEWIIVKGICDWADGNKKKNKKVNQEIAAKTAVSLCHSVFSEDVFEHLYGKIEDIAPKKDIRINSSFSLRPSDKDIFYVISDDKFVSREKEIIELNSKLKRDRTVFVTSKIGGLGKTEMVRKYIKLYKDYYKNVWFLPYDDKNLQSTIIKLLADVKQHIEPDEMYKNCLKLLREMDEYSLVIIDNFDYNLKPGRKEMSEEDWSLHDKEIKKYEKIVFHEGRFRVIFTSRIDPDDPRIPTVEVEPFETQEALSLFCINYGVDVNDIPAETLSDIENIIKTVARHTLTIVLIAKVLKESQGNITPNEMLLRLKNNITTAEPFNRKIELKIYTGVKKGQEEQTMEEHLHSIFNISESQLNENEKDILKNMCFMPVNVGVSIQAFFKWSEYNDFEYPDIEKSIGKLIRMGWLLKPNSNTIALHPVISDVIADKMMPNSKDEKCKVFIKNIVNYANAQRNESYLEHKKANQFLESTLKRIRDDDKTMLVAELYSVSAMIYIKLAEYQKAEECSKKEFDILKDLKLGDDNLEIIIAYRNHGYALYRNNKNREADVCFRDHHKLLEKLIAQGKEKNENNHNKLLAESYTYLAGNYYRFGDYDKANECISKALKIRIEVFGEYDPKTAETKNNKGVICDALGKYDEAINYFIDARNIFVKAKEMHVKGYTNTNPNTPSSYNNLGGAKLHKANQCNKEEAFVILNEALKYNEIACCERKEHYGEGKAHEATSYANMAVICCCIGDYIKAKELNERALEMRQNIYNKNNKAKKDSTHIAMSFNNIGVLHYRLAMHCQNIDEAKKELKTSIICFEESLNNFKQLFEEKHAYMITLNNNIETVQSCLNNPNLTIDDIATLKDDAVEQLYYFNYLFY